VSRRATRSTPPVGLIERDPASCHRFRPSTDPIHMLPSLAASTDTPRNPTPCFPKSSQPPDHEAIEPTARGDPDGPLRILQERANGVSREPSCSWKRVGLAMVHV